MKFLQSLFASELCVITFSYVQYHGRHKERKKPHGEKDLPKEKRIKKTPIEQNNLVRFSKGAIAYSCPPPYGRPCSLHICMFIYMTFISYI